MTRKSRVTITIVVTVIVVCMIGGCLGLLSFLIVPAGTIDANLALIEQYRPEVDSILQADPAYAKIRMFSSSNHEGSIKFNGSIESQTQLERLQELIEATSPPRPVFWFVTVDSEANGVTPTQPY